MAITYTYIPFGRKIDKIALQIPASSIARPSKNYPNWSFWFDNITSGNPGKDDGKMNFDRSPKSRKIAAIKKPPKL
jgi:hypothetical protein